MLDFKDFFEIRKYSSEAWRGCFCDYEIAEQAMNDWLDYCKVKESMNADYSDLPELLILLKEDLENMNKYDRDYDLVSHMVEGLEEIFEISEEE